MTPPLKQPHLQGKRRGRWAGGRDTRPHLLSALSLGQGVWMGSFQLQVYPAAAGTAKLFGQIRRQGVNGGCPGRTLGRAEGRGCRGPGQQGPPSQALWRLVSWEAVSP